MDQSKRFAEAVIGRGGVRAVPASLFFAACHAHGGTACASLRSRSAATLSRQSRAAFGAGAGESAVGWRAGPVASAYRLCAMLFGVGINLNPLNILGVAVTIDLRPPCPMSGFPAPESFEPCAMPPQDRLRLHHLGQIKQIGPNPRDPYQQRPVATVQPQTRRRPPQGDVELMTEKQVLGFQPASRLEYVGDEHPKLCGSQTSNRMM